MANVSFDGNAIRDLFVAVVVYMSVDDDDDDDD